MNNNTIVKNSVTNPDHIEAQLLLQDYLKLLYSPSYAENYLNATNSKLNNPLLHINQNHLEFETGARQRNLFKFFQTTSPLFTNFFPENQLRTAVADYCDSDDFWQFTGRTLVENFCIYFYNQLLLSGNNFKADITKLHGIISGLPNTQNLHSPWQNSKIQSQPDQSLWKELFYSSFQLVNKNGDIQLQQQTSREISPAYEITVIIKAKSSIEIHCKKTGDTHER